MVQMKQTIILCVLAAIMALCLVASADAAKPEAKAAAKMRFAKVAAKAPEKDKPAAEEDASAEADEEVKPAEDADAEKLAEGAAEKAIADEVIKRIQDGNKAEMPADWGTTEAEMEPTISGQFVPFGKHVPQSHGEKYYTASGYQECRVCKHIIGNSFKVGVSFHNLAFNIPEEQHSMAFAQQKVLQSCPEFVNNWCYQDLGGTQQLRSPCPDYLVCHYCLGVNPLHCVNDMMGVHTD